MTNEADTCRKYILPNLKSAGWEDDYIVEQLVLTPGRIVPIGDRHTRKEGLRPDYTLFIRQNIPIAVIEAKADFAHPARGLQQARQYAEMLGVKFAYSSNGNVDTYDLMSFTLVYSDTSNNWMIDDANLVSGTR